MSKTQKFIVTILVISVLYTILCFPVSANYVDMLDHGLMYTTKASTSEQLQTASAGYGNDVIAYNLYPYWAIETFNEDYTYTCIFSFNTITDIPLSTTSPMTKFTQSKLTTPGTFNTSNALTKVEIQETGDSYGTKRVTVTTKFNPKYVNINFYPVYITSKIPLSSQATIRTNGWSTSVEYDPGGEGYIQDVVTAANQIKDDNAAYHSNALEVLRQIKQNSDALPENIKQILNERDQSEKQEGQTQTEEGITSITDSLTNVIPVNSIIDSIKPLYNACTYQGTQSLWTLPGLSIPRIEGVIEETQISSDTQFDIVEFADRYIPDNLLSLIRSLNGIGIVVYSVYEVISLINQVITGNFKEKESIEL